VAWALPGACGGATWRSTPARVVLSLGMPDDAAPGQRSQRRAVKINPWARCAASAIGLAGVGSGGAAVFITHVEAGPVALIATGVLFLFVALGGVMPTRLRVGDNEAEWISEIEEAAVAVAVSAVIDDKAELAASIGRLGDLAPSLATSMATLMHMSFCYKYVQQIIEGRNDAKFVQIVCDRHVYMFIESLNGTRASVEPLANASSATGNEIATRKTLVIPTADPKMNRMLLILDGDPSSQLRARIDADPLVEAVTVKGQRLLGDFNDLNRSIEDILELDPD
jgi:hypothetical protein